MPTATAETTCCTVKSTSGAAMVAATWTACITASTVGCVVVASTVISRAIASAAVVASIPWPGAQEHSTDKPVRRVVAVWRSSVRWIYVVAIDAYWRSGDISRSESDPNADLGLGVGQRNQ